MGYEENDGIFFMDDADPLETVLDELKSLSKDSLLQKNIKTMLEECISVMQNASLDMSIRVNKVGVILDEICDDTNMESFCRTRVYNIAQLLERIC
ncbi:UPF0147 family protein [Candidatus Woesearchaeota archaeon]|nr:UPF0147 family protein [Candidatus Woesearchaeota archaeon]